MYYIGQLLEEQDITDEAKKWCKENNAHIIKVTDIKYEIRPIMPWDIIEPEETEEEIVEVE